jgi:hypothetical protein
MGSIPHRLRSLLYINNDEFVDAVNDIFGFDVDEERVVEYISEEYTKLELLRYAQSENLRNVSSRTSKYDIAKAIVQFKYTREIDLDELFAIF